MYIAIFAFVLIVFSLVIFVNGRGLLDGLSAFINVSSRDFWIVFILIQIVFIAFMVIPNKYLQIVAYYWLAFAIYFFLFTLIFFLFKFVPLNSTGIKIIEIAKLVLTLVVVIIGVYGAKKVETVTYEIENNKGIDELNVVLISDIHLGYQIGYDKMKEIVSKINLLNPDLVLIAGDIFNGSIKQVDNLEGIVDEFKKIDSKYGTFASLGNHDLIGEFDDISDFLKKSDITLLYDDYITFDGIAIVGRKDYRPIDSSGSVYGRKTTEQLVENINDNNFIIMIDHEPSGIDDGINADVDLYVSGHTHNGQFFPGSIFTNMLFKVGYGHEAFDDTNIVVTSGVGYWGPPIRVLTKSEIVNIKISSSN